MKQAILISVLAGAVAGAGGAMVTTILSTPVETGREAAPTLVDEGVAAVRREIEELRRDNGELRERLKLLEDGPLASAPAREPAEPAKSADYEELEAKYADLKAALEASPGGVPEVLRTTVRSEVQSLRDEEERQREVEREARRLERVDERLTELTETLGLDALQVKEMREVLLAESTRRDALMQTMRDGGGDWAATRQEVETLRTEIDARLTQILTPLQFEKYQESGGSGFGPRGRGGFFDRRGGRDGEGGGAGNGPGGN